MDHAIRQIVSRAVASDEVVDIFAAAGLKKPDISHPLRRVPGRGAGTAPAEPGRGAAAEAAQRRDQGPRGRRTSCRRGRSPRCWRSRSAPTRTAPSRRPRSSQELIELAKDMREAEKRGEKLGLTDDEVAFYDALETNDSAVKVLGEPTLQTIARELVEAVQRNVTIDWTVEARASGPSCA